MIKELKKRKILNLIEYFKYKIFKNQFKHYKIIINKIVKNLITLLLHTN